jgi:four helix bundle protein
MEYQFSFEKLDVWQKSKELVIILYKLTESFPKEEMYGLINQIRRASVSVASNLAEGSSRLSNKDKAHFTNMAYGSLMELYNQLIIANELKYIKDEELLNIKKIVLEISNKLNSLRKSQLNNSTTKQINN